MSPHFDPTPELGRPAHPQPPEVRPCLTNDPHLRLVDPAYVRAREALGLPPERRNSGVAVMGVIAVAMLLVGVSGLVWLFAGMLP
jgi:hypothetical protein